MPLLAVTLPDVLTVPEVFRLPPVMLPVTLTTVPMWLGTFTMLVNMPLLAMALPVTDTTIPVWLATFTIVVNWPLLATALPVVEIFPPMILPVADIKPLTYSPVVANTATLPVPPTPTVMLPPELTTVTFELPLLMLATDVITPVRLAPLPRM